MRPICWLHISDLHLHVGNEWSQNVVLQEMCRDIERKRETGMKADFILISGDIAFSGKAKEYDLAKEFLAKLQSHSGVPAERIFCVPGNHDIDRSRQRSAFVGARHRLQTISDINELLCDSEELATLLVRQEHYRNFQDSYFSTQCKTTLPKNFLLSCKAIPEFLLSAYSASRETTTLTDPGKEVLSLGRDIDFKLSAISMNYFAIAKNWRLYSSGKNITAISKTHTFRLSARHGPLKD